MRNPIRFQGQYLVTELSAKAIREWMDDGSLDLLLQWDPNIRLTYVSDALSEPRFNLPRFGIVFFRTDLPR